MLDLNILVRLIHEACPALQPISSDVEPLEMLSRFRLCTPNCGFCSIASKWRCHTMLIPSAVIAPGVVEDSVIRGHLRVFQGTISCRLLRLSSNPKKTARFAKQTMAEREVTDKASKSIDGNRLQRCKPFLYRHPTAQK